MIDNGEIQYEAKSHLVRKKEQEQINQEQAQQAHTPTLEILPCFCLSTIVERKKKGKRFIGWGRGKKLPEMVNSHVKGTVRHQMTSIFSITN